MSYFLGIDGGQSSTTALIADSSGRIVGAGKGGPCNHTSGEAGRQKFYNAITGCLRQATAAAGLNYDSIEFEAACLGFSGGAEDKDAYSRELIRCRRYRITHDAEIALAGATAGEPGIIIIAGTGSIAFGSNAAGKSARAGGWGYVFGDEGGGFDIARQALRAALRFEEGWGRATSLHRVLLERTSARDANTLLHRFYTTEFTRPAIAALSQLVAEEADAGDAVARDILNEAGRNLATYVEGVYGRLFGRGTPIVAYIGGVFGSPLLLQFFSAHVRNRIGILPAAPQFSPAAGAVLTALRSAGNQSLLRAVPESDK